MKDRIKELAKSVEAEVIAHRNHFHTYPEVSFKEAETSAYIKAELDKYGIQHKAVSTSVIGRVKGQKAGKTVAFRADIDALAMQEKSDSPYRSKNDGVMHACGHDAHAAALLGLAKIFSANTDLIEGEVIFIFQHAEEQLPGGAIELVKAKVMDDIDVIFGAHLSLNHDTGTVGYSKGITMASADKFEITLNGKGGHGAQPHETTDSLLAGTALIGQLQSIVSRNVSPLVPAVLSVCFFNSGTAFNIIPDSSSLGGTVRSCDEDTRSLIKNRVHTIAKNIAAAYDLECKINYEMGYPVLSCDRATVEKAIDSISRIAGYKVEEMPPIMGGEDFAYYTREKPGAFFFVGSRNREKGIVNPHHSPFFDIDEKTIANIVEVFLVSYFSAIK